MSKCTNWGRSSMDVWRSIYGLAAQQAATFNTSFSERLAANDELWPAPMQDHAEAHDAVFNKLLPLAYYLEEYTWAPTLRPLALGGTPSCERGGLFSEFYNPSYTWKLNL